MNLDEIALQKEALQQKQKQLAEELAQLNLQEYEIAKSARAEGLEKIGEIIVQYRIPKHEISELYRTLDVKVLRIPYGAKKADTISHHESKAKIEEAAKQYERLFKANDINTLIAKAKAEPDLNKILDLLPRDVEAVILEKI